MLELVLNSLSNPKETAPRILKWQITYRDLVLCALLVAALSGLFDALTRLILPLPEEFSGSVILSPMTMAAIQLISIFVISGLIFRVGQMFGGHGSSTDALKATVWISFIGLIISVITLLIMAVSPGFAQLFQMITLIWMLFLFATFIQVLHGFESFFTTMAGVLGTMFAMATVIVILLSVLGLMPEVA